jgi:hypothetical protein
MSTSGDERGRFFGGVRQAPIAYTVACVLLVGGVVLAFATSAMVAPPYLMAGFVGATWARWIGLTIVVGVAVWVRGQPWSRPSGPPAELRRLRQRREGSAIGAGFLVLYAVLVGFVAVKTWRLAAMAGRKASSSGGAAGLLQMQREYSMIALALAAVSLVLLIGAGVMVHLWRRTSRALRGFPGQCGNCGYNLRGLPEPRCPECGTPFTPPGPDK